jgi:hypothetical protein
MWRWAVTTLARQRRALCPRPLGPACALREHGQRLTGTGSAREKKRVVVAVARKLAMLLLSLWKHGTDYEPRSTASPALVMTPA